MKLTTRQQRAAIQEAIAHQTKIIDGLEAVSNLQEVRVLVWAQGAREALRAVQEQRDGHNMYINILAGK